MGIGIMSLACTVADSGIFASTALLLLMGLITIGTVMLLVDSAAAVAVTSYEDLARCTVGTLAERCIQIAMLGSCTTGCVGFLVSVKGMAGFAAHSFAGTVYDEWHNGMLLLALTAVTLVPMSFLRSLDSLKYTSALSMCCVLWFVVMTVALVPTATREDWTCQNSPESTIDRTPLLWPDSLASILRSLCIVMGSWVCQTSVFPIWKEMLAGDMAAGVPVHQTRKRFRNAMVAACVLCSLGYMGAALGGYFTWFSKVLEVDVVLECYDPKSWYVCVTYIGLVTVCLCCYPLFQFAARTILLRMAGYPDGVAPFTMHACVGVGLVVLTLMPALFISKLSAVVALGNAIVAPPMALQMPAVVGLKLATTTSGRVACSALLAFGVTLQILVLAKQ